MTMYKTKLNYLLRSFSLSFHNLISYNRYKILRISTFSLLQTSSPTSFVLVRREISIITLHLMPLPEQQQIKPHRTKMRLCLIVPDMLPHIRLCLQLIPAASIVRGQRLISVQIYNVLIKYWIQATTSITLTAICCLPPSTSICTVSFEYLLPY